MSNNCNKCGVNCKCKTSAYNAYNGLNSCNCSSSCGCNINASSVKIGDAYELLGIKCGDDMDTVIRYINDFLLRVNEDLSLEDIIVNCDDSPCGNSECCVDVTELTIPCETDTQPDLELIPVLQYILDLAHNQRYTFKSEDFDVTESGCNKEVSLKSDSFEEQNIDLVGTYSEDITQVINVYSSTTYEDTSDKRAVKRGVTVNMNSGFGFYHVGGSDMDFVRDDAVGYSPEYVILATIPSSDMQPSDIQRFACKAHMMSAGFAGIDSEFDAMIEIRPMLGYVEIRFYSMEAGTVTVAADKGVRLFSHSAFTYNV